uniref:Uncharacterized protein n=1 Tax=Panstrongylus lignarius TaxID=156445 RepID=A0A224XXX4_9HEMI
MYNRWQLTSIIKIRWWWWGWARQLLKYGRRLVVYTGLYRWAIYWKSLITYNLWRLAIMPNWWWMTWIKV